MEIKIGDKVRSFDFALGDFGRDLEGDRATYVEGVVIAIKDAPGCAQNCPHYAIEVGRDVDHGKESLQRVGQIVYPYLNYEGVEVIA